jgi:hypothetical protein
VRWNSEATSFVLIGDPAASDRGDTRCLATTVSHVKDRGAPTKNATVDPGEDGVEHDREEEEENGVTYDAVEAPCVIPEHDHPAGAR